MIALFIMSTLLATDTAAALAMSPGGIPLLQPQSLWPRSRQTVLRGEGQPPPNAPTGQELFLDGGFVYVPPPPQSETGDPRFHDYSFYVAPTAPTQTQTVPQAVTPTAAPPTPTQVPVQFLVPAYSATPTPPAESVSPASPTPIVVIAPAKQSDQGQFIDGGFLYIPAGPQSPDDPAFHRGTFAYSEDSDRMIRVPESASVVPLAQGAAGTQRPAAQTVTTAPLQSAPEIEQPETGHDWSHEPAPASSVAQPEMQTFANLSPSYYERTPLPAEGKAMYYNPGVMQEVLEYRLSMGQVDKCPDCAGYVALLRAGDLNRRVWIKWPNGVVEGPFLVIDVAATHHIDMLLGRGWVIDVDYRTAMRHGMNRPLLVTVYDYPPLVQPFTSGHTNSMPQ
jgi:hypothetical protein